MPYGPELETPGARRQVTFAAGVMILALAIRGAFPDGGTVTCELAIPRAKYDPFLLLDLIERHGGTIH